MADDPQRNFRSAYYEKVGFRGVEEKKSLEILLKDNPLGKLSLPCHTIRHWVTDLTLTVSIMQLVQIKKVSFIV